MTPTLGRIVHYRLSDADVRRAVQLEVERRCGNRPSVGDVVPLMIVRVWPDEYATSREVGVLREGVSESTPTGERYDWHLPWSPFGVNGQAFMDGDYTLWVTSAPQGDWPGSWDWPVTA